MVKVNGPLMSMDASGTLADAITFSKWKGRNYVRQRVIPSNPKSEAQTGRRAMFRFLSQMWSGVGVSDKATWQDLADAGVFAPFNAFVAENMKDWHNFLTPTQPTPAVRTNTPSDNVLTAAVWEENRIKLTLAGAALNDAWGMIIFAETTVSLTPSVGLTVLVEEDITIASHDIFWTPPSVTTWYFNSIAFANDGAQAAAGGEVNAVP